MKLKQLNYSKLISNISKKLYIFSGDVGASANGSEFFYDNILGVNFFATGMGGGVRDNFIIVNIDKGNANFELVPI
tara:strand:- start:642 stop:869 length:228 start_codon:yes stop_codon:yes gene_type:complete